MAQGELGVRSGHVIALRLFDLAYEIELRRAEGLWARRAQGASARSRLVGTPPKAVSFGVPPLALELEPVMLEVDAYRSKPSPLFVCTILELLPWRCVCRCGI